MNSKASIILHQRAIDILRGIYQLENYNINRKWWKSSEIASLDIALIQKVDHELLIGEMAINRLKERYFKTLKQIQDESSHN